MGLLRRMQTRWLLHWPGSMGHTDGKLPESTAVHPHLDHVNTTQHTDRRTVRFLRGLGEALRDLGTARAGIVPLPPRDDEANDY
jgi:hypothetical protein